MKRVTILLTSGQSITEDTVNGNELPTALAQSNPAFPLIMAKDGSTMHLNMRQVVGVSVEDVEDEPEAPAEDTRTVAELKEALDGAGVEYASDARKADLQELAKANGL